MDELAAKTQAVESLTQQLKSASDTFGHQVDALKTQEQQTADEFGRKLTDKETQLSDLQSTLESREQQLQELKRGGEQERREFQVEVERRTRQIADLQKSIQTLKGSFDPEAILKKADGRVLRAIPGSDIVYVNLGSANNIKVGMGFEVFPKLTMAGPLRGKASLEVVTLMENSAECRVTRTTPGQPIVEGDIVVNIAFEQNRKPKFVVRGEFDLNFDGQIDFDGADRIAAIIRQWGGQVVPELDESVDYVVVGVPPREGEVPRDASDVVRDQIERKRLERSEFRKLIDEARSMYIPVITQNQFLFLTGYAGNTDVISQ
jgi:TolA-binding protein